MTFYASLSSPIRTMAVGFVLALFISASLGCSFSASSGSLSDSSGSISDSISSPSKSSSESSGGGDDGDGDDKSEQPEAPQDAQTYGQDITQLAYTYGKQGGDIGSLRSAVSGLATKRGITNWEVDSLTCQSIGKGVGQAGMSPEDFSSFSKQLFGSDLTKATELQKGYKAGHVATPVATDPSAEPEGQPSGETSETPQAPSPES